jgi:hypothetical protein
MLGKNTSPEDDRFSSEEKIAPEGDLAARPHQKDEVTRLKVVWSILSGLREESSAPPSRTAIT